MRVRMRQEDLFWVIFGAFDQLNKIIYVIFMNRNLTSERLSSRGSHHKKNQNSIGNLEIRLMHVDKYLKTRYSPQSNEPTAITPSYNNFKLFKKSLRTQKSCFTEKKEIMQKNGVVCYGSQKECYLPYSTHARHRSGSYMQRNSSIFLASDSSQKLSIKHQKKNSLYLKTQPTQPISKRRKVTIKDSILTSNELKLFLHTKPTTSQPFSSPFTNISDKHQQTRTPIKQLTFYVADHERKYQRKISKKINKNLQTREFLNEKIDSRMFY